MCDVLVAIGGVDINHVIDAVVVASRFLASYNLSATGGIGTNVVVVVDVFSNEHSVIILWRYFEYNH